MTFREIDTHLTNLRADFATGKISGLEYDIRFEMLVTRLANQAKKGA